MQNQLTKKLVSNLQAKVDCFESFKNKTERKIKDL